MANPWELDWSQPQSTGKAPWEMDWSGGSAPAKPITPPQAQTNAALSPQGLSVGAPPKPPLPAQLSAGPQPDPSRLQRPITQTGFRQPPLLPSQVGRGGQPQMMDPQTGRPISTQQSGFGPPSQIVQGLEQVAGAGTRTAAETDLAKKGFGAAVPSTGRRVAGGINQAVTGAMQATAPVTLPAAAVRYGIPAAAAGLITGSAATEGIQHGLEAAGVAPEYSQAGGTAGGLATGLLTARGAEPVAEAMKPKSYLNPVEQSAVAWGQRNAPAAVNRGIATGSPFVRTLQELAAKQPFISPKVTELQQAGDADIATAGRRLARSVSPLEQLTPKEVSDATRDVLTNEVNRQHGLADTAAQKFRDIEARPENVKKIQVGEETSPIVGPPSAKFPEGEPITSPVYKDVNLPVDRTATKAAIKPIVDQMDQALNVTQRQASPGYQALRQVLDGPDQVNASLHLMDLSAIKDIARTKGELPAVKGISKGLAAKAIPSMEQALNDAVESAPSGGPEAAAAYAQRQAATKEKYAVNAILNDLQGKGANANPANIYPRLVRAGDRSADILGRLQEKAPAAIPSIARAYLDRMVEDMTYQGDLRRAQSAVRNWQNLGDQTKEILFSDPQVRQNITDFVNLAEMMTRRVNPSGSGPTVAAWASMMHPKLLVSNLLFKSPIANSLFGPYANPARVAAPPTPAPRFGQLGDVTMQRGRIVRSPRIPPP